MNTVNEDRVRQIVEEVVQRVVRTPAAPGSAAGSGSGTDRRGSGVGLFTSVEEAVAAADRAQQELLGLTLEQRKQIIEAIRQTTRDHAETFSRMALEETGIGRLEDKLKK
ncbi:MAG: hypothetical protein VX290_04920, partial [Candidatus Latescibacterota bacterium]|nr:hypothetical protein [Candidatus Latescibacterota bacterium]